MKDSDMGSSRTHHTSFPTAAADMNKHPESNVIQEPSGIGFESIGVPALHREESLLEADRAARDHSFYPELPHEDKPSLAEQGLHGAGAGIGIGNGPGGFAADANITAELSEIYSNIQKVLDLRHKYIRLSLQGPTDNPKDDPSWVIYPPPAAPAWDDEKNLPYTSASMANSVILEKPRAMGNDVPRAPDGIDEKSPNPNPFHGGKPKALARKLGQDIGEDFDMADLLPLPDPGEMLFQLDDSGIYQVYESSAAKEHERPIIEIPSIREYYMDLEAINDISSDGPSKSFAFRRLQYLEGKFNLYHLLNEYQEIADSKRVPHRDFYNVRKVDTHVHHSACMNQKHLLRFIKSKMKKAPDEVVILRDGKHLTLKEVFESINLTAYDLSIDTLDMHVSILYLCFVHILIFQGSYRLLSSF